jgi:hypothetical protein
MLTFSSRNLSEDCTKVVPGNAVNLAAMEAATAVVRLQAFASVPGVELVDSDARIYLANTNTKLAVQNENGRLFAQHVPEAANPAMQQTPEEIVGFLTGECATVNPLQQAEASEVMPAGPRKFRDLLKSPWTAGALVVVTAVMAYFTFSPEVPAGITMISDPARITNLHATFNGRYGEAAQAGQTVLLIDSGRFTVLTASEQGVPPEPLMDTSYGYGLRGEQVVLVVANGAVLERGKDGSMRFNDAVYPQLASPR